MFIIKVMKIYPAEEKITPKKSFDLVPIISNLVLIILSVMFIGLTVSFFRNRLEADSLRENRFLTMEWDLLKELKLQTDKQLSEKDRQISELHQRYRQLEQSKASAPELQEMKIQLKKLEDERADLILKTGKATSKVEAEKKIPLNGMEDAVSPSVLTNLLLGRIDRLEAKLEEQRLSSAALEKELLDLKASDANGKIAAQKDTGTNGKDMLAKAHKDALTALSELKRKKQQIDGTGRLSIEDLNTWTLLRALATSQTIKADYPDLLPAIESYFDAYGKQKFTDGEREAYTSSIKTLELIIKGME